jgi:phage shock protein PspC (stress-responsive transcriptional regulator)
VGHDPAMAHASPYPTAPPRRLSRSRTDRVLGGVAGGVARHLDVDPIVVRIAFTVLGALYGLGVLVYLVLWLVLPADPEGTGERHGGQSLTVAAAVIAGIGIACVIHAVGAGGGVVIGIALLLIGLALLIARDRMPGRR